MDADVTPRCGSSSGVSLPGRVKVSLLGSDSGSVCERGASWLQFSGRAAGGGGEERQGRAVEDPERSSAESGSVSPPPPFALSLCRRCLLTCPRFTVYVPGGRYDYLTLSGKAHVDRLSRDWTGRNTLSHIQVIVPASILYVQFMNNCIIGACFCGHVRN